MASLPDISPSTTRDNRSKLTHLNIQNDNSNEDLYAIQITPKSEREHDSHSQGAGILSPTRRGTRGSVTDFAQFLKQFNKHQETTKSMLSDYQETKNNNDESVVPKLHLPNKQDSSSSSSQTTSQKKLIKQLPSPAARNLSKMRHTISAAAQLKQHLTATIKPRKYVEEKYISAADAKTRNRLATRLHMLGFPSDPCLQALKQAKNKLSQAVSLLLKWYPKGQGGRNLVKRMVNVIESSECKLLEAHEKIKSVMADGSPGKRLQTVSKFFEECDFGDKGYLTPSEFSDLSSNLGVHLSTAELREAMMLIDEDGNGQVELLEYIEWWGDDELIAELIKITSGGVHVQHSTAKQKKHKKTKTVKSRSLEMGLDLPPLRISPSKTIDLAKLSPSAARNRRFAERNYQRKSASDYLEKSMAVLARHKERTKTSKNIASQIGMYKHIREGGWFDTAGNMQHDSNHTANNSASPKTVERRRAKAKQFSDSIGDEIAKMKDMKIQFEQMKQMQIEEDQ